MTPTWTLHQSDVMRVALPMFTRPEVAPLPRGVCPGCGGVAVFEDFDSYTPGGQAVRKRIYRCQLRSKLRCPAVTEIIGTETKIVPLASPELKARFKRLPFARKDKVDRVASLTGLESGTVRNLLGSSKTSTASPQKLEVIEVAIATLEQEMAVFEKRSEDLAAAKSPDTPQSFIEWDSEVILAPPTVVNHPYQDPDPAPDPAPSGEQALLEQDPTEPDDRDRYECAHCGKRCGLYGHNCEEASLSAAAGCVSAKEPEDGSTVEHLTPTLNHIQMANTLHVARILATLPRAAWEYALQLADLELQKRDLEARVVIFFTRES